MDGAMRAVSGALLTECSITRFTDVTVSRRPKRATSAAVLGVLRTKSRLGIRGAYSTTTGSPSTVFSLFTYTP